MNTNTSLTIGLFGFGCVGKGLHDVLERTPGLRAIIKHIVVKDRSKQRPLPAERFSFAASDILTDPDVNVVVELIDDAEAAFEIVTTALRNGKAVVTANKRMLATHLQELLDLQHETGQPLLYEASTCGAIPIIRNLEEYYDNDLLSGVEGIVNGTTNYILTQLARGGATYEDALRDAQQRGFAESDPTMDVEAWDAAFKTVLITAHAFGPVIAPTDVVRRGITSVTPFDIEIASQRGQTIKLVSTVNVAGGAIRAVVMPTFVHHDDLLASVRNETNAVRLHGAFADDQLLVGKGAGAHPTASAVLSDLSALRYSYRYEYKKRAQRLRGTVHDPSSGVTVYARGSESALRSIPWRTIVVDHRSQQGRYCIGVAELGALQRSAAFTDAETFLGLMSEADTSTAG
jgi:homoserine dehydrogenase